MNSFRPLSSFACVAALLTSAASAVTLTFTPVADTFVRSDSATSVAGAAATELFAGQLSATSAMHSVLSFNLGSIPDGATINSVSLVLRQASEDGSSAVTSITLNLHLLTETFVESQANWNNRATGTAWTTPGGTYDSTVLSSASVQLRPTTVGGGSLTLPIDRTWASTSGFVAAVQSVADSTTNSSISFLLKDANESNTARELFKFLSKEGASAPQLIIDYSVAAIPEPSTVAALMGVVVLAGGVWFRRRSA